jgi:uncharacterized membrane protein
VDRRGKVLWVLQWVLGLYFIAVGMMHFIVPDGLPGPMEWMYDLSDTVHAIAGTAEILGGLGLILPGLTRIRPELTVAAAVGLILVMLGAVIFHLGRDEYAQLVMNVVIAAALAYVAYGRWKPSPLPGKDASAAA